ncbi:MAG: hypothetical protein HWE26_16110 [Alteromonadaceae bacterium]|nr:hypothetical protein [Alteromonadaceae bacterium]
MSAILAALTSLYLTESPALTQAEYQHVDVKSSDIISAAALVSGERLSLKAVIGFILPLQND